MRALVPVILARTKKENGKKSRFIEPNLVRKRYLCSSPILEERWQCKEHRKKCGAFEYCVRCSFYGTAAQEASEPWGILQHLVLCAIRGDVWFLLFTGRP